MKLLKETETREGALSFANYKGSDEAQPDPKVTGIGVKLHTSALLGVLKQHVKCLSTTKLSKETNADFSCLVKFEGKDIMNGLDALYKAGIVKSGKQLPRELDSSELLSSCLNSSSNITDSSDTIARSSTLWIDTS